MSARRGRVSRPADGRNASHADQEAPDLTSRTDTNRPDGYPLLEALSRAVRVAQLQRDAAARRDAHDCDAAACGYYCDHPDTRA